MADCSRLHTLVYDGHYGHYGHYGHTDAINKDARAINSLEHEGCDSEWRVMNVNPILLRASHACASGLWFGWGAKASHVAAACYSSVFGLLSSLLLQPFEHYC
jgi:hypothetical protein